MWEGGAQIDGIDKARFGSVRAWAIQGERVWSG